MNEKTKSSRWCMEAASAILDADPCMCKGGNAEKMEHLGAKYAGIIERHAYSQDPDLSAGALSEKLENHKDLLHAALSYIRREIQGY